MMFFAAAFTIVGCVACGAWLVIEGHPFFGFFAMILGVCVQFSSTRSGE